MTTEQLNAGQRGHPEQSKRLPVEAGIRQVPLQATFAGLQVVFEAGTQADFLIGSRQAK